MISISSTYTKINIAELFVNWRNIELTDLEEINPTEVTKLCNLSNQAEGLVLDHI